MRVLFIYIYSLDAVVRFFADLLCAFCFISHCRTLRRRRETRTKKRKMKTRRRGRTRNTELIHQLSDPRVAMMDIRKRIRTVRREQRESAKVRIVIPRIAARFARSAMVARSFRVTAVTRAVSERTVTAPATTATATGTDRDAHALVIVTVIVTAALALVIVTHLGTGARTVIATETVSARKIDRVLATGPIRKVPAGTGIATERWTRSYIAQ
jgi:hypothetical protein